MTVAQEERCSGLKHQQDNHSGINNTWREGEAHCVEAVCFYSSLRLRLREKEKDRQGDEGRENLQEWESENTEADSGDLMPL